MGRSTILSKISTFILTGGRRTTASGTRDVLTEMANTYVAAIYDTAANFTSSNPVLETKQIGVESDLLTTTPKFKIGDGFTAWNDLPYASSSTYTLTASEIGSVINGAASATPNDTDLVMSVESSVAKKNTWTQIKAFLKTYFDTLFVKKGTLTTNYIPKATASDTIGNSSITDDGTNIVLGANSPIFCIVNGDMFTTGGSRCGSVVFGAYTFWGSASNEITTNKTGTGVDLKLQELGGGDVLLPNTSSKLNIANLTPSQIVATDASKNLQSLSTATYPSLTELSYAKGVTSSIQTQLDTKISYCLTHLCAQFNPADNTTYYLGQYVTLPPQTAAGARLSTVPKTATLTEVAIQMIHLTTQPSTENSTIYIRINGVDYQLSNTVKFSNQTTYISGLNVAINAGNTYEFKILTATWATNPVNTNMIVNCFFR